MTKRKWNPPIVVVAALLLCLLVAAGVGYYLQSILQPSYANIQKVTNASKLTIVLPKPLPQGSKVIDQPSYDSVRHVVVTRIGVEGIDVTFSQQRRPETDLEQIDAEDTFLVNAGPVYVLKGEKGRLQAIVQTSDSWIMVNSDAKLGVDRFKLILESLATF